MTVAVVSVIVTSIFIGSATAAGGCGILKKTGLVDKVVGGETVGSGTIYPWYVALTQRGTRLSQLSVACGGSLISDRHVLTAAHCYAQADKASRATLYRLVYLLQDRCTPSKVLATPQASSVEIHSRYNDKDLEYDIALITLDRRTTLTPVCLPSSKSAWAKDGEVIGYGSLQPKATTSRYPCKIQRVDLPLITKRDCIRTGIGTVVRSLSGVICAGEKEGGVDSCDGDSGGPLQTRGQDGSYTIRGIVSFGYGCARKDLPGVYTDVAFFRDWINARISGSGSQPSPPRPPSSPTQRPPRPTSKPTQRPSRPWFNFQIPTWLNSTFGFFRPRIHLNGTQASNDTFPYYLNDDLGCTNQTQA